jgi:hypothetical protein
MTSLADLEFYEEAVNVHLSQLDIPWPCAQNSVIITSMNTKFNHRQTAALIPGASFKNCRLSALTQRFYNPGYLVTPTAQGFSSSLVVLMGTNCPRTALLYIHLIRIMFSYLPNLPNRPMNSPMVVCNRVSSGFSKPLDTKNFERQDSTRVVVHTASFSAVRYMCKPPGFDRNITFSFFPTGNYIVTGLPPEEALVAFTHVYRILKRNELDKVIKPSAEQTIVYIKKHYRKYLEEGGDLFEHIQNAYDESFNAVVTREDMIKKSLEDHRARVAQQKEEEERNPKRQRLLN